jgi:hypothetical protein
VTGRIHSTNFDLVAIKKRIQQKYVFMAARIMKGVESLHVRAIDKKRERKDEKEYSERGGAGAKGVQSDGK